MICLCCMDSLAERHIAPAQEEICTHWVAIWPACQSPGGRPSHRTHPRVKTMSWFICHGSSLISAAPTPPSIDFCRTNAFLPHQRRHPYLAEHNALGVRRHSMKAEQSPLASTRNDALVLLVLCTSVERNGGWYLNLRVKCMHPGFW